MAEENPNIIIVGDEQVGKTRLLERIALDILPNKRRGFLTREEISVNGEEQEVSYYLQELGEGDIADESSIIYMGRVIFKEEDNIVRPRLEDATKKFKEMGKKLNGGIILADDITLMDGTINEVNFYKLVNAYLNSPNLLIATCSSLPERMETFQPQHYFANAVLKREDARVFDLTPENREEVYREVSCLIPDKYKISN